MNAPTRWVVITGPPYAGKTTLLNRLAAADETTSADASRRLLTEVAAAGRDAEEFRFADDFQPRVVQAMIDAEAVLDPGERTFLEYAVPCNIAFQRTEARELTPGLAEAARAHRYEHVFILDPVGWQTDAQRVEDPAYQAAVHGHMWDVYRELGYDPIRLPAVPVEERYGIVRMVLEAA